MTGDDFENSLREGMHGAIDPIVPGANAANRVMDAVTTSASQPRRRFAGLPIGQGLGTVLMASVVVMLVGGALGLSLALRAQSGQPLPGPAVTPGSTDTPMVTPTPSPGPTSTPSPIGARVADCVGSMLTASFTDFDGAAGSEGGDIALTNSSGAPCTMDGYTNLRGRAGVQVTQLGVTHVQATLINNSNGTMPTVQSFTLQSGQTAYVAIEWTDVQSTSAACSTFQTLVITPPSGQGSVTMSTHPLNPTSFMFCASHGAAIWINEAPVSLSRYFSQP